MLILLLLPFFIMRFCKSRLRKPSKHEFYLLSDERYIFPFILPRKVMTVRMMSLIKCSVLDLFSFFPFNRSIFY